MLQKFTFLCFTLLALHTQHYCVANPYILAATEVFKILSTVYSELKLAEGIIFAVLPPIKRAPVISDGEKMLISKLDALSSDFRERHIELTEQITDQLLDKLTERTDSLFKHTNDIQFLYSQFLDMYKNLRQYPVEYVKDYAESVTTVSLGQLRSVIAKMYRSLIEEDIKEESTISIIADHKWVSHMLCLRNQTSQQLIYQLYNLAVNSHMKGMLIILFGFTIKEKFESISYEYIVKSELNTFLNDSTAAYIKVKNVMKRASIELYKCSPRQQVKGETFLKLGPVFQAYFVYQFDTTLDMLQVMYTSCESTSMEYVRCHNSLSCKNQPQSKICTGQLRSCTFVDRNMQFCHSPENSERRYEWMKGGNGLLYGREEGRCDNTQGVGSILNAHTCVCDCVSPNRFEARHFSLQNVMADIQNNKVVTGLRFVKRNYIFYIQIQQGLLGSNGTITDTPEWVEVNEISNAYLLSRNVSFHYYKVIEEASQDNNYERKYDSVTTFYKNDLVYTVTFTQDTVFLDTLQLNKKEVVVGVRFKQVDDNLKLEIIGAPFDYSSGQLNTKKLRFVSNDNKKDERSETYVSQPDDPSRSRKVDTYSNDNSYVTFRMTDLLKDLGQNTVPFLDSQEVTSNPPLPLSGAGIYYKAERGFGGFLGLKLVQFDFLPYF